MTLFSKLINSEQASSFIRSFFKFLGLYLVLKGYDANAVDQIATGATTLVIALGQSHMTHSEDKPNG